MVSDSVHFAEVERFSKWCRDNSLDLNVKKNKGNVDWFQKSSNCHSRSLYWWRESWKSEYKYLGTVLNNKLNFNKNTYFIHKRYQPRIFCLQKLRYFNVSTAVLRTFYRSCFESVLTFSFLWWFAGLSVKSKNVLNKVMNVCGKVVGERQEHLSQLYECHVVRKARVIVDDNSYVLAKCYEILPPGRWFGRWFRVPKFNTVNIIFKQINLLKCLSSVCVCVCVYM